MTNEKVAFPPETYMELVCGPCPNLVESFKYVGSALADWLDEEGMLGAAVDLLDAGCGCGRVARYLIDKPIGTYTGFDRHAGMIEWCSNEIAPNASNFQFHHFNLKSPYEDWDGCNGDISVLSFKFPFADQTFDSILLASVFTHMPMEESVYFLEEARRMLKPGGKILLSVFFADERPDTESFNFYYDGDTFRKAIAELNYNYEYRSSEGEHNWYVLSKT